MFGQLPAPALYPSLKPAHVGWGALHLAKGTAALGEGPALCRFTSSHSHPWELMSLGPHAGVGAEAAPLWSGPRSPDVRLCGYCANMPSPCSL